MIAQKAKAGYLILCIIGGCLMIGMTLIAAFFRIESVLIKIILSAIIVIGCACFAIGFYKQNMVG